VRGRWGDFQRELGFLAARGTNGPQHKFFQSKAARILSMQTNVGERRSVLKWLAGLAGVFGAGKAAQAFHTETHFEETTAHKVVYQCNKADRDYLEHVLFSVGELVRKYGDDIHVVVTAFGPGLHILGKTPGRPIPEEVRQRASSLAQYGVSFHACGNTMDTLGWTEKDIVDYAKIVQIGADDLIQLQEQGYGYISW
jgi:intracellular sulfur oxidation DsrE/DsrF family protein